MITQISLNGHDSELFSFLDDQFIKQLQQHPAANKPLWTFGLVRNEHLASVPMLNRDCFAWTAIPGVCPIPLSTFRTYKSDDPLIEVSALALVRYMFSKGYTCSLDDRHWIRTPADRQLERLNYIRSWFGKSPKSPEWPQIKAEYFGWCMLALNQVAEAFENREAMLSGVAR